MQTLVAYVPVLHEGYRRYFESVPAPRRLLLIGPELTKQYKPLTKEIRELEPKLMAAAIGALGLFESIEVLTEAGAKELNVSGSKLLLPDEDVSRELAKEYFPEADVSFSPIFLRWDKHNSIAEKPVVPEERIARDELHRRLLALAEEDSKKSSDIWRHVGALIAKDGEPLFVGHNQHLPSEHTPYVNGDPRSNFSKGEHIEISSGFHAEASLIAEAARRGVPLEGADMYTTVFPCPPCAKLIAHSGIKNLYCGGGYAILDGEDILKAKGVKIYFVE